MILQFRYVCTGWMAPGMLVCVSYMYEFGFLGVVMCRPGASYPALHRSSIEINIVNGRVIVDWGV